jgi:ABC-type nickel/cobalt efflux system permease component RcnA
LSGRVRDGEWTAGFLAFGLALVFGVVHIAGPGHGKLFAISYFSGRHARPVEGIAYSAIVNAVDSISAFVIVMLGYVVLRTVLPAFRTQGPTILAVASYSTITLFGIVHLITHIVGHKHEDHDEVEAAHASEDEHSNRGARPTWLLALSVGLVPCPVSTILIVYGIANSVLPLMILMVIGVSIGGFILMSVLSVAVISGRSKLFSALNDHAAHVAAAVLEYTASGMIIVFGIVLLIGAL